MNEARHWAGERLNALLTEAGLEGLDAVQGQHFEKFLSLILRWNSRVNLTSIRDEEGILSRHFVESIACARALPSRIATLLDFGSGAGLPGVPIAICRPEIAVTLAESHGKKAAFLQEAVRSLEIQAKVHPGRAEVVSEVFDCVVLRAVERMAEAMESAVHLVAQGGWLAAMTTEADAGVLKTAAGTGLSWAAPVPLPRSEQRILMLGQKLRPAA